MKTQNKKNIVAQKASFKMFQAKSGQTLVYPSTPFLLRTTIKTLNATHAHTPPGKEQEN